MKLKKKYFKNVANNYQIYQHAFRITKAIETQEIIELVLVNGLKNKQ